MQTAVDAFCMPDDLDQLFGVTPAPRRAARAIESERLAEQRAILSGRPRPTIDPNDDTALHEVLDAGEMPDAVVFTRPVSITFLAKVLGVETRRLHNKLSKCPIVGYGKVGRGKGMPLYDFKEAIRFCVEPKVDIAQWIKSQSSTSLPPMINKVFWEAERVKMKVKYEAGELWHTADAQRVWGEAAMTIKEAMMLWVENLPGVEQMSSAQYDSIRSQVIALQTQIYEIMVEKPRTIQTRSYLEDIEKLETEGNEAATGEE